MVDRRVLVGGVLLLGLWAGGVTLTHRARVHPTPSTAPPVRLGEAAAPRTGDPGDLLEMARAPAARPGLTHAGPRDDLRVDVVEDYRRQSEYPPDSRPLTENRRDLIEWNRRYERPTKRLGGGTVLLTADRYWITDDAPLRVTLETWDDAGRPTPPQLQGGTVEVGSLVAPVQFRAHGARAEAAVQLAEWAVTEAAVVQVEVQTLGLDGRVETHTLRAAYTPPSAAPARFTGALTDNVVDGSLWVDVGVEVAVAGHYVIDANLYAADGAPVLYARFKGELAAGEGTAPLRFFGRALADRPAGRYRVGELRGQLYRPDEAVDVVAMAPARGQLWTAEYPPDAFSGAPWDSPQKRAKLAQLEALRGGLAPRRAD